MSQIYLIKDTKSILIVSNTIVSVFELVNLSASDYIYSDSDSTKFTSNIETYSLKAKKSSSIDYSKIFKTKFGMSIKNISSNSRNQIFEIDNHYII